MRNAAVVILICVTASGFAAGKDPWRLSADERTRIRFGATERADRVGPDHVDHIDGRKNPELFLSTELFEALIVSAFVLDTGIADYAADHSDDLFRGQADWDLLAVISADYVTLLKEERALRSAASRSETPMTAPVKSQLRDAVRRHRRAGADALRSARSRFGRERFDRFLYIVIAPTNSKTIVSESPEFVAELIALEKRAE